MWDIKLSPAYPAHVLIMEGKQEIETWHLSGQIAETGYVAVFIEKDPDVYNYMELMETGQTFLYQILLETYARLASSVA